MDKNTRMFCGTLSGIIALALPMALGAVFPPIANFWWSIGIIAAIWGGEFAPILVAVALIGSYASVVFLIWKSVMYAFQIIDR